MRGMALEVSTQDVCHEVNLSRGGQFISNRARARYACRTNWCVLANDGYVASYWRNYHQRVPGRRLLWKAQFADVAGFRRGIVGVREVLLAVSCYRARNLKNGSGTPGFAGWALRACWSDLIPAQGGTMCWTGLTMPRHGQHPSCIVHAGMDRRADGRRAVSGEGGTAYQQGAGEGADD